MFKTEQLYRLTKKQSKLMKKTERIYIGIDFAKEKFDACYLDEDGAVAHAVFQNVRKDYRKLLSWVRKNAGVKGSLNPGEVLFCGEHTGECSLPLSEWLVANGYRIWLDNPVRIRRSAGIVRGKSDKADALMIAQYAMEKYRPGQSMLFVPDSESVKELRSLYSCRMELVKARVGMDNRIGSGSFRYASMSEKALKKIDRELTEQADSLEVEIERLMASTPELASNYRILVSFKGIGVLTAAMFIIYTNNFTRFSSPREFACHIGVAPFGIDSGKSIHGGPHVSNFAHKKAKAALVQSAKAAIRFNPAIREYARRLRDKGKHEGVIMNNVKNKIIHIVFKMIKSGKEWKPDYQQSHTGGDRSLNPPGVKKEAAGADTPADTGGNRSPEPPGVKKEAAGTATSADTGAQSSPSASGNTQNHTILKKSSNLLKNKSKKICIGT